MISKSTFAVVSLAVLLGISWASSETPRALGVQGVTGRVTVVNQVTQPVPISLPESPLPITASSPLPVTASTDLPVLVSGTTLVREVANPALNYVRWSGVLPLEKDLPQIDELIATVRPGQRLVIQHFAIRADGGVVSGVKAEATIRVPNANAPGLGRVPINVTSQTLSRGIGEDLHFLSGSKEMTLYVGEGEGLQLEINFGPEPTAGGTLYWTLIGYVVENL